MGISSEKHVLDASGEIVYRSAWMSEAMRYADEHGFSVIRDMSNGEIREKDEYGVWIVQPAIELCSPQEGLITQEHWEKIRRQEAISRPETSSDLLSRLLEMAANPPGMNGVLTENGYLGSAHVDLGWVAAVRMVVEMVTEDRRRQRTGTGD